MADEASEKSESGDSEDIYPVGKPDEKCARGMPPAPSRDINEVITEIEKEQSRFQFSMGEMLLLVGIVALFLGILGCFPREYSAGLAGLGALASMLVLILLKPTQPIIRLGWWIILLIYVLMVVTTIMEES